MSKPIELPSDAGFQAFITAIECSMIIVPAVAAGALARVRDGIITGEGPTTKGRIHFSRTLDAQDAALCERILMAAGGEGEPVTRAEAEVLIEIDAAAAERVDTAGSTTCSSRQSPITCWRRPGGRSRRARWRLRRRPRSPIGRPKRGDIDAEMLSGSQAMRERANVNGSLMTLAAFLVGAAADLDGADARGRRRHARLIAATTINSGAQGGSLRRAWTPKTSSRALRSHSA